MRMHRFACTVLVLASMNTAAAQSLIFEGGPGKIELPLEPGSTVAINTDGSYRLRIKNAANEIVLAPTSTTLRTDGSLYFRSLQPLTIEARDGQQIFRFDSSVVASRADDMRITALKWNEGAGTLTIGTADLAPWARADIERVTDESRARIRSLEESLLAASAGRDSVSVRAIQPQLTAIRRAMEKGLAAPQYAATRETLIDQLDTLKSFDGRDVPRAELASAVDDVLRVFRLTSRLQSFDIKSSPTGAQFQFVAARSGLFVQERRSDVVVKSLTPGNYRFRVSKRGYANAEGQFNSFDIAVERIECELHSDAADEESICRIHEGDPE